jgi:hypothetical protein
MRYILSIVIALASASVGSAQEPEREVPLPYVTLVQPPEVATLESNPLSEERITEIESLIHKLSEVEQSDLDGLAWHGYVGARRTTFVPVGRFGDFGVFGSRDVEVCQTIRRLIEIGPDAMPYLLESLEDASPTGVVIQAQLLPMFPQKIPTPGGMAFDEVLQGNPANPTERFVLNLNRDTYADSIRPKHEVPLAAEMESYRLKVGDICMSIIGEIVGRDYDCLRKGGGILVCSPVHRKMIRNRIRRIWKSENSRQKVLESLLMDFSTRGLTQTGVLDEWDYGNDFQIQSVVRLLHYFPDVATPLVAQRLKGLRVSDDYIEDCLFNGIRIENLIDAVAWSRQEAIRTALLRIATAVRDVKDMLPRNRSYFIEALRRAEVEIPED